MKCELELVFASFSGDCLKCSALLKGLFRYNVFVGS